MIHVAICDDEKRIGAELERTLAVIFDKLKVEFEVDVYFAGAELYKSMEAGIDYDLIFLDIEFAKDEVNGVEVGRLIREAQNNHMVSIVYISWEQKYSMQLFDVRPFNFLIKPLKSEKIEQVVKAYLNIAVSRSGDFIYKTGFDTVKVPTHEILYVESSDRKLILHLTCERTETFYGTLKDVYREQLQALDFLFIHSAYVVNYDYIETLKFNELTLADKKTSLPISRNRGKEVREIYCSIMERRRI